MNEYHNLFIETVLKTDPLFQDKQTYGRVSTNQHASHNHIGSHDHGSQIYGRVNISDVLDKHLDEAMSNMRNHLNKQIYGEHILLDRINQHAKEAEKNMSTIDKITQERREKREREEAEAKFDHWEQLIGGTPEEGAVIAYTKTVDDEVNRYAAIFTDGTWQTTRNGQYDVEGFIRFLIVTDIEPGDLTYMEPLE